ncbi:MAG: aminoacyl-tRNA hydrolase [Thermodesulfobacteria bacterium]|nr:aminoacyl-tRNA hydrolase [Thermodesulfobacteriota bacterium]
MIKISNKFSIPEHEIHFIFSRSSGPGGQNVNKVNTKATLRFDLDGSRAFPPEIKRKLRRRLSSRINQKGILTLSSDRFRSQRANREDVLQRFIQLLEEGLKEKPVRKKTTISRAAKERRLRQKHHRSQIKKARKKDFSNEW